jgi:hypothetical protein
MERAGCENAEGSRDHPSIYLMQWDLEIIPARTGRWWLAF